MYNPIPHNELHTNNPPTQNQQISKSTILLDKIQHLGWGHSTQLFLVLYWPLNPTPRAVFYRTALITVF